MADILGKWPSKRGPISKIRPSDGSGRNAVFLAGERKYDFHGFGWYLGNVGLGNSGASTRMGFRASVLLGAGIGVAALSGFALAEPLGIGGSDVKQAPTPTHQWIYGALVPALVQIAAGGNATVQLAQAAKKV